MGLITRWAVRDAILDAMRRGWTAESLSGVTPARVDTIVALAKDAEADVSPGELMMLSVHLDGTRER